MMTHLVGSVSWSEQKWQGVPSDSELKASGHGNLRAGYIGNECLNLSMDANTLQDGWKYAAIEKFHTKKNFSDGGLVFLWCSRPKTPAMIYGVLAKVERLDAVMPWKTLDYSLEFNLRLPALEGLMVLFNKPLEIKPKYMRMGDGLPKKGPGQACGCYIDDQSAKHILHDADEKALLALYGW
jgi:hypothetical protein